MNERAQNETRNEGDVAEPKASCCGPSCCSKVESGAEGDSSGIEV
jgi:hypothetical protein